MSTINKKVTLLLFRIHKLMAYMCLLLIISFWTTSVISEGFLSLNYIIQVKSLILFYGIPLLIVGMMSTGVTGALLAQHNYSKAIHAKKKRMPIIAIIGLLVMVPLAFTLYNSAVLALFDARFYWLQALELLIGMVQIRLMLQQIYSGTQARQQRLYMP